VGGRILGYYRLLSVTEKDYFPAIARDAQQTPSVNSWVKRQQGICSTPFSASFALENKDELWIKN
jgi:hypothetical protein